MAMSRLKRLHGLLAGGALGDAIGSAFEGAAGGQQMSDVPATAWAWTDDTELTVATCEAIAARGAVSAEHIAEHLVRPYLSGIRGLGATTAGALRALSVGGHWALCGIGGERAAGNGAAMRIAPLGLFLDPSDLDDRRLIRDVVRITHHNDEAYAAALAVVAAVSSPGVDEDAEAASAWIERIASSIPDSRTRDALRGMDPGWSLPRCAEHTSTSGYAPESVPLAIFAALNAHRMGFEQTLSDLVQIGGDVDTIASIAGQTFGAAVGVDGLPDRLLAQLPGAARLAQLAQDVAAATRVATSVTE